MMRSLFLRGMVCALAFGALAQAPPTTPDGRTLAQVAAQDALITVVITTPGGLEEDPNLRITRIYNDSFATVDLEGDPATYLFEEVFQVRVQDGLVEERALELKTALSDEQQEILLRALERAQQILNNPQLEQAMRIRAAGLLVAAETPEAINARALLLSITRAEDIEAALEAATWLHLAGDPALVPGTPFPADALQSNQPNPSAPTTEDERRPLVPHLLERGLDHGSREVRARAAMLTGLVGAKSLITELERQMNDRIAELAVPAAKAMANLAQTSAIPRLLDLVMERTESKGEAAIYGLQRLGDAQTAEKVKRLVPAARGMTELRLARVLFALGDPMGREMLEEIVREMPTVADQAALALAREKVRLGIQVLESRLERRENPTVDNLRFRAKAAATLYQSGDPTQLGRLADLLRSEEPEVIDQACEEVTAMGKTGMMNLLTTTLESGDPRIVLHGACTVMALADRSFRERYNIYKASL